MQDKEKEIEITNKAKGKKTNLKTNKEKQRNATKRRNRK